MEIKSLQKTTEILGLSSEKVDLKPIDGFKVFVT